MYTRAVPPTSMELPKLQVKSDVKVGGFIHFSKNLQLDYHIYKYIKAKSESGLDVFVVLCLYLKMSLN